MKRTRLTSAIAVATLIPALGLGLDGAATAGTITAGHDSEGIVVLDCLGHPQVRPGRFTLACADGDDYLTGLTWTSWGPGLASATGVQAEDDCVPYCAAGHFHSYPVDVVFWGGAAAGPAGQRYTRVSLLYPGARPAYAGEPGPATFSRTLAP